MEGQDHTISPSTYPQLKVRHLWARSVVGFTWSLKSSCHLCVCSLGVISQHCNMMPFVDFRILSLIQTRASEFRGHWQAHTTSFRWLVWMWSSNPWKVVTGGNSKRTFPQAITYHVFSSYIYQPITEVNYCSPWQTNLNHIASASDGRNIVLWVTLIFLRIRYQALFKKKNQSVYEEIAACVFEFINSVLFSCVLY